MNDDLKPGGAGENQEDNVSTDNKKQETVESSDKEKGKPDDGKPASDDKAEAKKGEEETEEDGEDSQESEDKSGESVEYSDFDLPEDVTIDENLLNSVLPVFKKMNLTQEQAQEIVSVYADHVKGLNQGQLEAFNSQQQEWVSTLKADPEIGGDKFEENAKIARDAVKQFGADFGLLEALDSTGMGNNPAIFKTFHKIGLLLQEDTPESSGSSAGEEKDIAKRWYPNL